MCVCLVLQLVLVMAIMNWRPGRVILKAGLAVSRHTIVVSQTNNHVMILIMKAQESYIETFLMSRDETRGERSTTVLF